MIQLWILMPEQENGSAGPIGHEMMSRSRCHYWLATAPFRWRSSYGWPFTRSKELNLHLPKSIVLPIRTVSEVNQHLNKYLFAAEDNVPTAINIGNEIRQYYSFLLCNNLAPFLTGDIIFRKVRITDFQY